MFNTFSIEIYGKIEQISPVISKARCRIFYKYGNRNGTYITDEFANKFLKTLSYTPVKGIFDEDKDDFTDHGRARSEGRIFGITPAELNFAWEPHLDKDGVERIYACTDVYLFTALYPEAKDIVGKPQSMEIYPPSIQGHYEMIDSKKYFVYDDACFLGLQVLGDDVEPCFEGAGFEQTLFSLNKLDSLLDKYVKDNEKNYTLETGGTELTMKFNFKLSDQSKVNQLFDLLNTNYNEEGGWEITYSICNTYEDHAVVYEYETGNYYRVYFTKENDTITLGDKIQVYIIDVTEEEKNSLEAFKVSNNNTYTDAEKVFEKISDFETKITDKDAEITTLKTERDTFEQANSELNDKVATLEETKYTLENKTAILNETVEVLTSNNNELTTTVETYTAQISELTEKVETLESVQEEYNNYKKGIEDAEKLNLIDSYSSVLAEDTINSFKETMNNYDVIALEKELAFSLVKQNGIQMNQNSNAFYSHTPETDSLSQTLDKYQK